MGNGPCHSSSRKPLGVSNLLFNSNNNLNNLPFPTIITQDKPSQNFTLPKVPLNFTLKAFHKPNTDDRELKETAKFIDSYMINKQINEVNHPQITSPKSLILQTDYSKYNNQKVPQTPNRPTRQLPPSIPTVSFKSLFTNEEPESLQPIRQKHEGPYRQEMTPYSDSLQKQRKDTKNSTPNFYKSAHQSVETNELLPYLPMFASIVSEEKPRKLTIEQMKPDSLRISEENPLDILEDRTCKEFSMDEEHWAGGSSNSDSSEPQQIHINLLDLLQNQLKTRRNSLSNRDTPVKTPQNKKVLAKNESQSSLKTLKKTDYLSPLQKSRNPAKESLHLSNKK